MHIHPCGAKAIPRARTHEQTHIPLTSVYIPDAHTQSQNNSTLGHTHPEKLQEHDHSHKTNTYVT